MKLIGYWMENLKDTQLPLPQELVGDMTASVRNAVCDYLDSGRLFETYRGYSWCRFRCDIDDCEMGCREFTDGEWVWPEGLAHYVKVHSVLLPEEFVSLATSTRRANPDGNSDESLEFWVSWAKPRQSLSIRQRLSDALAAARAAEPALIQSTIASAVNELLQRETEGSEPCVFAGCSNRALTGRRVCARHMLNDDAIRSQTIGLYRLPHQF